jgi:stage III sporulation protein AD
MDIVKIIGIGLLTTLITIILKEYKKEYAIYCVLIGGAIILFYSLDTLKSIINFLLEFSNNQSYNSQFIYLLLKITGISILTEYAVSICKDSGENAIANKIDFGGKILVISISIPVISTTLETLTQLLP